MQAPLVLCCIVILAGFFAASGYLTPRRVHYCTPVELKNYKCVPLGGKIFLKNYYSTTNGETLVLRCGTVSECDDALCKEKVVLGESYSCGWNSRGELLLINLVEFIAPVAVCIFCAVTVVILLATLLRSKREEELGSGSDLEYGNYLLAR